MRENETFFLPFISKTFTNSAANKKESFFFVIRDVRHNTGSMLIGQKDISINGARQQEKVCKLVRKNFLLVYLSKAFISRPFFDGFE